ncbi:hypothetical protein SAMN05216466_107150 [Paraburkholderia phenazinium]|uniref:Uncharacterized protein n=1 Tax=Paraburkholderia phenazinium TaxID=60549 RepID=A0A1G7ZS01_9BURK|nr:hypothetical protein [Paraburkholderia phenazinium]SDH11461.1 hypothetical protein SAMN05216466_107150 [Paraburkholderia phenazinium]
MSKYEKLDDLIVASLGDLPKTFGVIHTGEVASECERIAKEEGTRRSPFGVESFRICDRRLQALRKAGRIVSTTRGWVLS